MSDKSLQPYVESLIFTAKSPIDIVEIKKALDEHLQQSIDTQVITECVNDLVERYRDEQYSFHIIEVNHGYLFTTKGAYHGIIGQILKHQNKKKLSKTALETLAIVAYRQPVTKGEIESIRGVSADYAIQKLLDKELVEITGRSEALGKPLLYATSAKFMNYFGLKSIDSLPKLKELDTTEFDRVTGHQQTDTEEE